MIKVRRMCVAVLALCFFQVAASAQVLKQVPSAALVVAKVTNIQAVSKKVGDLAGLLGISQQQPDMADPLAALQKKTGFTNGLNKSGDLVFAYIDPAQNGGVPDKSMIVLVPVSDYAAFLGNFPDAKTEGDISEIHPQSDPEATYVVKWGDYAAVSPSRQLLAQKPDGLDVTGATGKELDSKDFVIYANFKTLKPKLLPNIDDARKQMAEMVDSAMNGQGAGPNGVDIKPFVPAIKVLLNQFLNVASEFVSDSTGATLSGNIGSGGIAYTVMAEFQADSYLGKNFAQIKNTDASLLAGLPDAKYLVYGGTVSDAQIAGKLLGDFIDPVVTELNTAGDNAKPIVDMIAAAKSMVGATHGEAFGMLAPSAQGGEALLQWVQIRTGDSKAAMDAAEAMVNAQTALFAKIDPTSSMFPKTTFTAAAKTVDGVTFSQAQSQANANPQNEQQARMLQIMQMMYGGPGPTVLFGALDAKTLVGFSGISDATISALIASAKGGTDTLSQADGVKTVAAQLPAQRIGAVYIALDQIATTGLGVAKQFGMGLDVKIPDNLPPLGVTVATEGTAVRVDAYLPTTLIQAITSAAMQLRMSHEQPGNGGGM